MRQRGDRRARPARDGAHGRDDFEAFGGSLSVCFYYPVSFFFCLGRAAYGPFSPFSLLAFQDSSLASSGRSWACLLGPGPRCRPPSAYHTSLRYCPMRKRAAGLQAVLFLLYLFLEAAQLPAETGDRSMALALVCCPAHGLGEGRQAGPGIP